jgi:hypothetical protein
MWKICKNVKSAFQNTFGINTRTSCEKEIHVTWYAQAWKMWPQTLICKIILIESSSYIYNRIKNANINYLKLKSCKKCVTCVNFSPYAEIFFQVSKTSNTFNVLFKPCVSNIVVHFD